MSIAVLEAGAGVASGSGLGLRSKGSWASHPLAGRGLLVKRSLDILVATAALLLALPLILLAVLAVRLETRGPVLFKQERVGRGGQRFRMYKIRSMRSGSTDDAHRRYVADLIRGNAAVIDGVYKLAHDPRVTRVGKFIRRYSIDELPQLWNVLRGDMSLVGPRPALPHEVELYDGFARQRLAVDPGVTGLWQVSGRCRLSFDQMVELDVAYYQQWTPLRDLRILARTPAAALAGRGAA